MATPRFQTSHNHPAEASYRADRSNLPTNWENLVPRVSLGIELGIDVETGAPVVQPNEDRFRHTVVLGRTGTGKSNLVQQMEREDILNGAGCFILAASQEDALYPLQCVPQDRMDDVVLIDASNTAYLPCLNPLDVNRYDAAAVDKAVSDCLDLLKTDVKYDYAGPRFDHMARIALQLMLHPKFPDEPHLGLIERLYTDPEYVKRCLTCVKDDYLTAQWRTEADAHRSSDHGDTVHWFLSKVGRFTGNSALRAMFGPGSRTVNVKDVIDQGKILIAAVPAAHIGTDAARLVSSWLITQLRDAILQRNSPASHVNSYRNPYADLGFFGTEPGCERFLDPFFVYIDEFAQFANDDFVALLAQSRKYRVGFTLSFQTLSQTRTYDMRASRSSMNLHDAVLGNVGSFVAFSVGSVDAEALARHFDVDEGRLKSIRRYEPLAQLCLDGMPQAPRELSVPLKPQPENPQVARQIALQQVQRGIWLPVD